MGFLKNNVLIAVLVLILFVGGGAYYVFKDDTGVNPPALSSTSLEGSVDQELLLTLLQLKSLKLDSSIFMTDVFQSLIDFSLEIPDEPTGRTNPFLPVGKDPAPANQIPQ